jgi:hypothetical protein
MKQQDKALEQFFVVVVVSSTTKDAYAIGIGESSDASRMHSIHRKDGPQDSVCRCQHPNSSTT